MGTWSWLGPLIMAGGTALGGFLGSRRTREEKEALGSQTDISRMLADMAQQQFGATFPGLQSAIGFYQTLLGVPQTGQTGRLGGFSGPLTGGGLSPMGTPRGTFGSMLGGAGLGATIGSVIPGIGTAVGAGVGSLVGGVSGLFGRGRKQAKQIVPTQNQLMSEVGRVYDEVERLRQAGTLTQADLQQAHGYIQGLQQEFYGMTQDFGRAGPGARTTVGSFVDPLLQGWADEISRYPAAAEGGGAGGAPSGPYGTAQNAQRLATEQVLAVPIQSITDQYESAKRNVMMSMPAGGDRDQKLAKLDQERAAAIGRMFQEVPQQAASALANIGMGMAPNVTQGFGTAIAGQQGVSAAEAARRQGGFGTGLGIGNILAQMMFFSRQQQDRRAAEQQNPLFSGTGSTGYGTMLGPRPGE